MTKYLNPSFWTACLCVFLGIALQIQITLFHRFNEVIGLRLCLADLALPVAGAIIAASLLLKKSRWPQWGVPYFYGLLAAMVAVMIAAFFNTHAIFDEWSRWAMTNKLPGIIVIAAYACLGGWIGANAGESKITLLFRCLFFFFTAMMVMQISMILWQDFWKGGYFTYPMWPHYPIDGLMDNRNAYGLFCLMLLSFIICFTLEGRKIVPRSLLLFSVALIPYLMVQIGSRSAFIALALMLVSFLILYRQKFLPYIAAMLVGGAVLFVPYEGQLNKFPVTQYNEYDIIHHARDLSRPGGLETVSQNIDYPGDSYRLEILNVSFDMIKERPLFGSGLGSSIIVQDQRRGRHDIIENTPVWLWVETGLVGLIVFGAFYILCVRAVIRNALSGEPFYAALNKGMAIALLLFSFTILVHEMLMMRQVWFFVGLALGAPIVHAVKKRQDAQDSLSPAV